MPRCVTIETQEQRAESQFFSCSLPFSFFFYCQTVQLSRPGVAVGTHHSPPQLHLRLHSQENRIFCSELSFCCFVSLDGSVHKNQFSRLIFPFYSIIVGCINYQEEVAR